MSRAILRAYVVAVVASAIAVTALLPSRGLTERPLSLLILLALAAVVGTRSVRMPSLKIRLTAGDAFTFCALEIAGPMAAPMVALLGTAGSAVGSRPRSSAIRSIFNLGAVTLAGAVAAWARESVLALSGSEPVLRAAGMLAAAAAFFLVNTVLVALAVRIQRGTSFFAAWNATGLWTAGSTLASVVVGAGLFWFVENLGAAALLLGLGAAVVLNGYYRSRTPAPDRSGDSR